MQRSSHKAQAVSAGLEGGWLAFVCGPTKRRLAPFPAEWRTADVAELERLCGQARVARSLGAKGTATAAAAGTTTDARSPDTASRPRVPRIRSPRADRPYSSAGELPINATATSADAAEETVRAFAHQARLAQLPAIEAMVQLKALLARVYTDPTSAARDIRAVRRWFVEAYYFEREVPPPDSSDQSR